MFASSFSSLSASRVQFQCDDLSRLSVVKQLASDKTFAPLHRLLEVVARGTYADFSALVLPGASRDFIMGQGLPLETLSTKMRLLTLVSMGKSSKQVAYTAIAEALQVGLGEVEEWVMRAISSGLMTAKMDQVHEVVTVSVCADRDFGDNQWALLHKSLTSWRGSIAALLQAAQSAHVCETA